MKLVPNAGKAWRWFSVQAMTIAAALPFAWGQMPHDLKQTLPEDMLPWLSLAVLVGGVIGRLVDQGTSE